MVLAPFFLALGAFGGGLFMASPCVGVLAFVSARAVCGGGRAFVCVPAQRRGGVWQRLRRRAFWAPAAVAALRRCAEALRGGRPRARGAARGRFLAAAEYDCRAARPFSTRRSTRTAAMMSRECLERCSTVARPLRRAQAAFLALVQIKRQYTRALAGVLKLPEPV